MGMNCKPLVADLFPYCYCRDCMLCLDSQSQADVISAFNDYFRNCDDIFNIDYFLFAMNVPTVYPKERKLDKSNTFDTSVAFLGLDLSIDNWSYFFQNAYPLKPASQIGYNFTGIFLMRSSSKIAINKSNPLIIMFAHLSENVK